MNPPGLDIEFSGEFFVPGKAGPRIEADHLQRYRFAAAYVRGCRVLDIACGIGYAGPMLVEAGAASYLGVDLGEEQIAAATRVYSGDRIAYQTDDICRFDSALKFDVITCFETIEHVQQYGAALRNLFHLLAGDGMLLVSSPNRTITSPRAPSLQDRPDNPFHTQEFTPGELVHELRDAGFKVDPRAVYGQRQRRGHKHHITSAVMCTIFGNPDETTSAVVAPVTNLVPRYFVVRAGKP